MLSDDEVLYGEIDATLFGPTQNGLPNAETDLLLREGPVAVVEVLDVA